jgi:hypothetical protein
MINFNNLETLKTTTIDHTTVPRLKLKLRYKLNEIPMCHQQFENGDITIADLTQFPNEPRYHYYRRTKAGYQKVMDFYKAKRAEGFNTRVVSGEINIVEAAKEAKDRKAKKKGK